MVIIPPAPTEDEFQAPSKEDPATGRGILKSYFDEDVDVENREERIAEQKEVSPKKMKNTIRINGGFDPGEMPILLDSKQ